MVIILAASKLQPHNNVLPVAKALINPRAMRVVVADLFLSIDYFIVNLILG